MLSVFYSTVAILTGLPTCHMFLINFQGLMPRIWCKHVNPWTFYAQMTLSHCILIFFSFFYLWEKTEIIKFSKTIQELPHGKVKHPVSSFIFACTFVFLCLSFSVCLLLYLSSPFLLPFMLFFLSFPSLQPQGFWLSVIIWQSIRFHFLAGCT